MKKAMLALLSSILIAAPAPVGDDIWAELENAYYLDAPVFYSELENSDFLEPGEALDWSRAVERYSSSYDLSTEAGVEQFLSHLGNGGKIADTLTPDNRWMVYVQNSAGSGGTAIINPESNTIVGLHHGDEGELFLLQPSSGVQQALLVAGLKPDKAQVKQFLLEGLAHCILYTDGQVELLQPVSSYPSYMSGETAYTTQELLVLVQEHRAELTQYEGVNTNLDPIKPNVIVGAGAEGKPNVATGR